MAVTIDTFRAMALAFPETFESAHMGHPELRGCTHVILKKAGKRALKIALAVAWRNAAPRKLVDPWPS